MTSPHVVILLATYQGAPHLRTQLTSIAGQVFRDWSLVVSDDGSTDGTREIVQDFAASHPQGRIRLIDGPGQGATANFLSLLDHVPSGSWAAFCDQDDLWFPDKLARAVEAVAPLTGPAHYAARTIIADADLRPLVPSRHFRRPLGLRNALVQACMAGNTSVFNAGAVAKLQQGVPHARRAGVISHDWWAYQVTAAYRAHLIHDPRPALLYRQHSRSEVGRNDTAAALAIRLRKLMAGEFGPWLRAAHDSLIPLDLPSDSRQVLAQLDKVLGTGGIKAVAALSGGGFYRQTRAGSAALVLSALSGALRA